MERIEPMSEVLKSGVPKQIALIGFGEAGSAFAMGWQSELHVPKLCAFDIKATSNDADEARDMRESFTKAKVAGFDAVEQALKDSGAVFSLVTADQALIAAKCVAHDIEKDALYFDCNSCAPDTKREAADIIENAGGRYVDVAIMAPVHPRLHKTATLVCGPHAEQALKVMTTLGMSATQVSTEIGTASSIKMVRSVMMKGLEALMAECVLAGRRAGIEDAVLQSLEKTYPGFGWEKRAAYMLERTMVHGKRRAAEMREVALTVEQLGLSADMTRSTGAWQQRIGDLELDAGEDDYQTRADAILAELNKLEDPGS